MKTGIANQIRDKIKRRHVWAAMGAGLLFIGLLNAAMADTVVLNNGRRVEGLVQEKPGRNQIEVILPGSKITFDRDQITTCLLDTQAVNFVISGHIALSENKYTDGLNYFLYAMGENVTLNRLKPAVILHKDKIFPKMSEKEIANRPLFREFCNRLRQFAKSDDELLALCARSLFILDEYQTALETYNLISKYYYTTHPEEKSFVVNLIQREIGEDIAMGRIPLALQKAEVFAAIEPTVAESCKVLAYLNWAGEEKRAGNLEESLRICRDEIYPLAPIIARDRIGSILDLMKARAIESKDYEPALKLAREYTAAIDPDATNGFILSLVERAVNDALQANDWALALELIKWAPEEMQDKALRATIQRIEFHKRQAAIAEGDHNAYFKLGEWAMSHGLMDEAADAYSVSVQSETLKLDSQLQIDLINRQRQTDEFRIILTVYESGDYMRTLERATDYMDKFPRGQYTNEIKQLMDLTQQRLASEEGKRPLKAEVVYQQAERAYVLGEYGESLANLRNIDRLYSDTPAGEKSQFLKAKVLRAMEMARMESLTQSAAIAEVPLDQLPSPVARPEVSSIQDEMQAILNTLNSFNNREN